MDRNENPVCGDVRFPSRLPCGIVNNGRYEGVEVAGDMQVLGWDRRETDLGIVQVVITWTVVWDWWEEHTTSVHLWLHNLRQWFCREA